MEMFYFQLVGIICLLGLGGYFIYSRNKVAQLNEKLMDKKIVINELAEHANRMEKEISAVIDIKPVKVKKQNSIKQKTEKVSKVKKTKK
jgi:hypothetical protein